MNAHEEFDRRMAALHGRDRSGGEIQTSKVRTPVDVRHEEFTAMVDCFLGADYDPAKRKLVEDLQIDLHKLDVALYSRLQKGELSAEQFAEESSALMVETARKCEAVLGGEDFEKLFGVSAEDVTAHRLDLA